METAIRLNTDDLTIQIIESIQKMFPHQTVEFAVQLAGATESILSNPAYSGELLKRIEEYRNTKNTVVVDFENYTTLSLLSPTVNRQKLQKSISELNSGNLIYGSLEELKNPK